MGYSGTSYIKGWRDYQMRDYRKDEEGGRRRSEEVEVCVVRETRGKG